MTGNEETVQPIDDGAIATYLAGVPTLSGLARPALELLAKAVVSRTFQPGEALMEQGTIGDCMMILQDGLTQVGVTGRDGIQRMLAQCGEGTVLGEMALLTKEPRSADVLAILPTTALVVSGDAFEHLVEQFPDVAVVLTHLVAERLGHTPSDALGDKVFSGYRIKQRLGVGATAVVYRGEDVRRGRVVALKMLSHRLAFDDVAIRRFHRELDIVERLRHPNVALVYGRFEAFATCFMAMEFCDGCDLDDFLKANGALPEAVARAATGQIARALTHVHGHDVVHKDLKPANVMVNRDGNIKLMDFGIARPPLDMTQDNDIERLFAGTPRYMAPEQFRMAESGPEVDVYALGCLLLEMLAGEPPFETNSFGALVQMKSTGAVEQIAALRPHVSADTLDVLERMMAPSPAERFQELDTLDAWAAEIDAGLIAHALGRR